ncbi:hypothetical protein KRP22_007241 [Phytophthora ramorum]|nr:Retrovirus-related Pol polyprotein from transposon 17.6 [Phytophthora ramorum]
MHGSNQMKRLDGTSMNEGGKQAPAETPVALMQEFLPTDSRATRATSNGRTQSETVVRVARAIGAQLVGELNKRDGDRARRSVATVRPAMTALRYVHQDVSEEKGIRRQSDGRERLTGEGGKPAAAAEVTTTTVSGSQLDDGRGYEQSRTLGNSSQVQSVGRQLRKNEKKKRVQRALQKAEASHINGKDVDQVVVALNEDRRERRRKQARDARLDLEARHQQRRDATRPWRGERAKVSLVQHNQRGGDGRQDGDDNELGKAAASDGLPTAEMVVDGERVQVKLDSGARYSVAGTDWMQRGERVRQAAPVECVEGIGGFLLDVLGVWTFCMRNAYGQLVQVKACIIEGCTDEFLIGVDFMRRHRAMLDFERNEVRYFDHNAQVVIPFRTSVGDGDTKVAAVRLVKHTRLMRSSVTPMEMAVVAPDGEEGVFVPMGQCGTVMLATTLTTAKEGKALVPAINVHGGRVKLPARKELGTWVPVDAEMQVLAVNGEMERSRLNEWLESLGDSETPLDNEDEVRIGTEEPTARELVLKLLRAYRKVTTSAGDCPPVTALDVEHHIDTGDVAPIMLKRRRHAQKEDGVIENNVATMLQAGVIEEGNGAWGFPVVLVRKKDGEVRFCVDYRALNKVTKKDVYPLPRIDETLEALGGARLFTTLDLRSGYWQISVAPGDRDKTAFTTKRGLYRFVRMPFGLMNAPSTFQRMMNGVLRGLTWTTCLVYLDDIVVYTRGGIERHIVELATVLERLSVAGLTLKLKKCMFATTSMEYLGHELSTQGVRPVERLVKSVSEFPRPNNPVDVKRFVHLAGYYRKFIEAFGSIMAPMTRLLKKDSVWEWTENQEFAFERVKAALTTKPLLVYPNFELPFRLVTDASKIGLGTCLMQDQGRGWQPIAFASKVNSREETNYSITELECLAVVWAVKLFRPYLYGRTFTIITDHSALRWLMTRPELAGRLHRWSLTLQEYEFEILYRPGSTNVVADALSRAPAVVLAATGRKIPRRRTKWAARAAEVTETEGKTEDDDPVRMQTVNEDEGRMETDKLATLGAVAANHLARVNAMATDPLAAANALQTDQTAVMVGVNSPTGTLVPGKDERTQWTGGRAGTDWPLTRAAKRRMEAEAVTQEARSGVGRSTEPTSTNDRNDKVVAADMYAKDTDTAYPGEKPATARGADATSKSSLPDAQQGKSSGDALDSTVLSGDEASDATNACGTTNNGDKHDHCKLKAGPGRRGDCASGRHASTE